MVDQYTTVDKYTTGDQYTTPDQYTTLSTNKQNIIQLFNYLSLYLEYFVIEIYFFKEQMLRSVYSTVHALGLVPASTISRACARQYHP